MTTQPAALPLAVPDADGLAGAWRRLWRRRDDAPQADYWTAGVTYRGYLGADGIASAAWMTEQQMKETQALLRMAAAAGRLGAWAIEVPAMKWLWSDEVKAIHGVSAGFVPTARSVLQLYTRQSQAALSEALELCAARGVPFDLELQLATGPDAPAWIHVLGEADRDAEGRITHVRGAMQDVSRFRAVADEARRTAERLTQTLERLPDGFILLDHEWRFVYLNPEAERILRRRRDELMGRCLLTEFPETAAGRFLERCEKALRDGTSVEFGKYYPPLGIWMHIKVSPSDLGLTLCIHDDTERITARRELLAVKAQLAALKAAAR
jgi:PAS domain S-box-containing protein